MIVGAESMAAMTTIPGRDIHHRHVDRYQTTNAPLARAQHNAVWTGTEMIVWGGAIPGNASRNTGGKYNPATDSWTATSTVNVPAGRSFYSSVD